VEGNFITFNGRRPHRTVITHGSVDLLGPFDMLGAKCVAKLETPAGIFHNSFNSVGDITEVQSSRQLNEELEKEIPISGKKYFGDVFDSVTNETTGYILAHNATGFPKCLNGCNISIALSNAQVCTMDTHDEATMILISSDLTYTTDNEGNTGVKKQTFQVDRGNQTIENILEDLSQVSVLTVYFYDEHGELVACSLHQPITEEEEQEAIQILAMDDGKEAATNAAGDGGESSGGSLLLLLEAFLAIAIGMFASFFLSSMREC
jgi:hypothetical protein